MVRWIDYHSVNEKCTVGSVITLLKMVLMKLSSDNKSWFLWWANDLRKMWYHYGNEVTVIIQWENDKERKWSSIWDRKLEMRYCNHPSHLLQHPVLTHHHAMRYSYVVGWLVTINQYCDRRNGKGKYKEFTSYQHGVVSITWWNMTELQAHRWVDRMI